MCTLPRVRTRRGDCRTLRGAQEKVPFSLVTYEPGLDAIRSFWVYGREAALSWDLTRVQELVAEFASEREWARYHSPKNLRVHAKLVRA
jgi:hypothetical protein